MKINLKRVDDAFHFEAMNEDGRTVHIDAGEKIGGKNKGVRPMQMLLMATAGCAAIDIISILKKQRQEIKDFDIDVEGEREKAPSLKGEATVFTEAQIHFKLKGKINPEKAKRATELSMKKYCSVAKTLRAAGAKIEYKISINNQSV